MKESSQQGGLLNEQTGIDRIREALQAHTWPSMTMKNDKTVKDSSASSTSKNTPAVNQSTKDKNSDLESREIIGKILTLHINGELYYSILIDQMLGKPPNEDEDNDKFDKLFDKFMAMKGKV